MEQNVPRFRTAENLTSGNRPIQAKIASAVVRLVSTGKPPVMGRRNAIEFRRGTWDRRVSAAGANSPRRYTGNRGASESNSVADLGSPGERRRREFTASLHGQSRRTRIEFRRGPGIAE